MRTHSLFSTKYFLCSSKAFETAAASTSSAISQDRIPARSEDRSPVLDAELMRVDTAYCTVDGSRPAVAVLGIGCCTVDDGTRRTK